MPSKKYRKKKEKEAKMKNKTNEQLNIDVNKDKNNNMSTKSLYKHMKRNQDKQWKRARAEYGKR